VSDRAPGSGVAVWIALRRAHRGGVANLAGHWLDSGRPVPGYLADALDGLISAELLALAPDADPESGGVRRVTVTDAGCVRYLALCQVHNPRGRAAVGTPRRWAVSPYDQRSHLLAERGTEFDRDPGRGLRAPHAVVVGHQRPAHRAPVPNV
jgi:hypothetical protein